MCYNDLVVGTIICLRILRSWSVIAFSCLEENDLSNGKGGYGGSKGKKEKKKYGTSQS